VVPLLVCEDLVGKIEISTSDEMDHDGRKFSVGAKHVPLGVALVTLLKLVDACYLDEWYAPHNPYKAAFSRVASLGRMVGSIPKKL